jgi:hypothetical protein
MVYLLLTFEKNNSMKALLTILIASALNTFTFAQSKEIIIKLNHVYDGVVFNINDSYLVDGDTPAKFSRMEYYLHLNSIGETSLGEDNYILVNTNQTDYSIGTFDISDVNTLSFHIGVAPGANHSDPSLWSNSHPLAPQQPSMHWGWAAGYRFIAVEGMVDENIDGMFESVLQYHAVDDAFYSSITISGAAVEDESSITFFMDVNYHKMFANINTSDGGVFHGSQNQNLALINNIVNNNVFTVAENLALSEATIGTTIFPNPFTNAIHLNILQNSSVGIYNTLGELIEAHQIDKGEQVIKSSHLPKGVYILSVKNSLSTENTILIKK